MGLDDIVKVKYDKLNENDLMIWGYIAKNKAACSKYTIEELAKKCNVSRTTILRFAKKLDFEGFSELKIHLKLENRNSYNVTKNVMLEVCNDYRKLIDEMEHNEYTDACTLIYHAKNIFVWGSGAVQSSVAKELCRVFMFAGKYLYHVESAPSERNQMVKTATEEDLVIIISFSGESDAVINLGKALKLKNVPFISITRFENNTLAKLSSQNLYVSTSSVKTAIILNYDTTALFFIAAEMLLLRYILYVEKEGLHIE